MNHVHGESLYRAWGRGCGHSMAMGTERITAARDEDALRRKHTLTGWLLLLILLASQLLVFLHYGQEKDGFHEDELFTYTLSNAYYQGLPYVVPGVFDRYNKGSFFRGLLVATVPFSYDSVYHNQAADVHPPLYYLLHHTASSLFPQTFSKWIGIVPNLIYMAVSACLLHALSKRAFENAYLALLPCAVWGFSPGASTAAVFIRMYALQTVFILWLCLLFHRLFTAEKPRSLLWIQLFVCVFLGFMTHYYFLIFLFFLFCCGALYLLRAGRSRQLLPYFLAPMLAGVAGVLFFPACVKHIFTSYRGREAVRNLVTPANLRRAGSFFALVNRDLFGGRLPLIAAGAALVCLISVCLTLARRKKGAVAERLNLAGIGNRLMTGGSLWFLSVLLSSLAYLVVVAWVSPFYVSRYLSALYPVYVLLAMRLLYLLFAWVRWRKIVFPAVMAAVFSVCLIVSHRAGSVDFLYRDRSRVRGIPAEYNASGYVLRLVAERDYSIMFTLDEYALYDTVLLTDFSPDNPYFSTGDRPVRDTDTLVLYLDKRIEDQQGALAAAMERHGLTTCTFLYEHTVDNIYLLTAG